MRTNYPKTERILSLDVFRGLTIILMIIVNSPGNRSPYSFLEHSQWNGCTLADIVFPCFLFIVGMSTVISLNKQNQSKSILYKGIIQRSAILFIIGIILNVLPNHFELHTIRVYGVLQRIAICYLICSIIYLNSEVKTQILVFTSILLGYWCLMTQIPVPGFGANQLNMEGSWVSYFDQLIFSASHLYATTYDPEGFLSTLPSVATTLAGIITGNLLLSLLDSVTKWWIITFFGALFMLMGGLWNYSFPINKDLWSSSFVLWTSGVALLGFAFSYLIIDIAGFKKWTLPFKIFGMNALTAFILHVVLLKLQSLFQFPLNNDNSRNFRIGVTQFLFNGFSPANAALLYTMCFLILNFIVIAFLYQRKIFIRI